MIPLIVQVTDLGGVSSRRPPITHKAEFRGVIEGRPHIAKVIYTDSRTGANVALNRIICAWSAECTSRATTTREHPDRGRVPVCHGCRQDAQPLPIGGAS